MYITTEDMQRGSDGKESACSAGDPGLIPGLGISPGEGNRNPLRYSFLENPIDRGPWQASPWGHKESDTAEGLTLSHADDTSLMAESEEKPLDEGEIAE